MDILPTPPLRRPLPTAPQGQWPGGTLTLLGQIGRGGHGLIYEGVHLVGGVSRPVAVKWPLAWSRVPTLLCEARWQVGQRPESRIAPVLGVIPIDPGFGAEIPALVMHRYRESVYAEASQMPGFAFPAPQAVQIVMNTALALYASGAVHLDLKPDNLLLDAQGEAWLADFGISVPANPEDRTRLGIPLAAQGTPAYMSPEQMVVLASLDQRSDIYALGLILFELVTGRPSKPLMAPGQTMHQYLETLFETDPDWSLITDPELRRIANTAGCRMRKRRYETHLDLHADLAVWLESHVGS